MVYPNPALRITIEQTYTNEIYDTGTIHTGYNIYGIQLIQTTLIEHSLYTITFTWNSSKICVLPLQIIKFAKLNA